MNPLKIILGSVLVLIGIVVFYRFPTQDSVVQIISGGEIGAIVQPKLGAAGPQEIISANYKDKRGVKDPIESDSVATLSIPTYTSATTTDYKIIPARKVITFDTEFLAQGACLKIKDADGSGAFTFITANKGVLSVSVNSCE